jgi:hypothetical protein
MIGRANVCLLVIALLFTVSPAEAQAPKKLPRIGYFSLSGGSSDRDESFKQGLRELGWVDKKNYMIAYRWVAGKLEQLAHVADELVRLKGGRDHCHFDAGCTGRKERDEHNPYRHARGFRSGGLWIHR